MPFPLRTTQSQTTNNQKSNNKANKNSRLKSRPLGEVKIFPSFVGAMICHLRRWRQMWTWAEVTMARLWCLQPKKVTQMLQGSWKQHLAPHAPTFKLVTWFREFHCCKLVVRKTQQTWTWCLTFKVLMCVWNMLSCMLFFGSRLRTCQDPIWVDSIGLSRNICVWDLGQLVSCVYPPPLVLEIGGGG